MTCAHVDTDKSNQGGTCQSPATWRANLVHVLGGTGDKTCSKNRRSGGRLVLAKSEYP